VAHAIVDTSVLLAYFDASEPDHAAVAETVAAVSDLLIVSPYVVAELNFLVATRHGVDAGLAVLSELTGGAWELAGFGVEDLRHARSIVANYRDQEIGVADASIVVLAERYGTRTIATLDHRLFNVLRSASGNPFDVLPKVR
jgi:predicted nucleic acid-binding protein